MSAIPIGPTCQECGAVDGHRKWCGEARWEIRVDWPAVTVIQKRYETVIRVLARVEDITWSGPGQAYVSRLSEELHLSKSAVDRALRKLVYWEAIERVPCSYGRATVAYEAVRKS